MRNRNHHRAWRYRITGLLIVGLLSGCWNSQTVKPETGGTDGMEPNMPDLYAQGTLHEIRYEYGGGDMEYRTAFLADVTAQEIVEAEYWPEEYTTEPERIEHQPITAEQWAQIVRSVNQLRQFMVVQEESEPARDDREDLIVLDGGDYENLYLTMEMDGKTETYSCRIPQDRRFTTLRTILRELAEPKGREIVWYDAPEIAGIWFHNNRKDYSYQVTKFESDETYILRAYWVENGQKQSLRSNLTDEDWESVQAFCNDQHMMDLPKEPRAEIGGTLYLSDGRQYAYKADAETAETCRAFFMDLTKRIQSR